MDFAGGSANSVWEFFKIREDALGHIVTCLEGPAVINVDILVASVFQSQIYNLLCRDLNCGVVSCILKKNELVVERCLNWGEAK